MYIYKYIYIYIYICIYNQTVPCALGSTQPLKMSTRIFLGVKTAVRKGDSLTNFMCRVSRNSGALTYPKPQGPLGL